MRTSATTRLSLVAIALVAALAAPSSVSAATYTVTIVDFAFTPAELTINPGDTVVFTNVGTVIHAVLGENRSFETGSLSPGRTSAITFNTPGRYPYFDTSSQP